MNTLFYYACYYLGGRFFYKYEFFTFGNRIVIHFDFQQSYILYYKLEGMLSNKTYAFTMLYNFQDKLFKNNSHS